MGLATLGTINRIPGDAPPEKLITARHPRSPTSEAYRSLRTSLRFSSLDHPLRSLIVTSANALEGKSTMAANLAVVMAQTGSRVVLVDADLRRPMVHKIFQVSNKEGLTNILFEDRPVLDGHLQETGIENLRVLPSGPLPPNPSELLGSQKMRGLLEQIKEEADIVVFDTPPILPVTDAVVLAPADRWCAAGHLRRTHPPGGSKTRRGEDAAGRRQPPGRRLEPHVEPGPRGQLLLLLLCPGYQRASPKKAQAQVQAACRQQ